MAAFAYASWDYQQVRENLEHGGGSATLPYIVIDTDDESEAREKVKAEAPAAFEGLVRKTLTGKRIGAKAFHFDVAYGDADCSADDTVFSFNTQGGVGKAMYAHNTTRYGTCPEVNNAVNITTNGETQTIEGYDVVVPALEFQLRHCFDPADLTMAYIKTVSRLTGTINAAPFKNYDEGELLFVGADGNAEGTIRGEIEFAFMAKENLENLSIGDVNGIDKKGHQILWPWNRDKVAEDQAGRKWIMPAPKGIYVQDVYRPADWSGLGIGT